MLTFQDADSRGRIDTRFESQTGLLIQTYFGTIDLDGVHDARDALIEHGAGRPVRGVILDSRASRPDYELGDFAVAAQDAFEALTAGRCAWVFSGDREVLIRRLATVTAPLATRVQPFEDIGAARAWLLGQGRA